MNDQANPGMSQQLGTAPIGKLLLKLAAPTVVAQLVNLLYNIVDRIYIGHMPQVGALALTGIGLCFPVIYLIGAFTMLVAQGGAPRAAIAMGSGDNALAEKIMGGCFTCLVAVALALTMLWGGREIQFTHPALPELRPAAAELRAWPERWNDALSETLSDVTDFFDGLRPGNHF